MNRPRSLAAEATSPSRPRRAPRRGMTLIELLVVLGIVLIVMAATLPALKPALESRAVREAARSVSTYLGAARTRAMESGRPCGVLFERDLDPATGKPLAAYADACLSLSQVEVPAPYAGDTTDASVKLRVIGGWLAADAGSGVYRWVEMNLTSDGTNAIAIGAPDSSNLVRYGDQIQFGAQGPLFEIAKLDPASKPSLLAGDNTAKLLPGRPSGAPGPVTPLPWPDWAATGPWSAPMPYRVFRGWQRTPVEPLVLPANTAIDLGFSGLDDQSPNTIGQPHVARTARPYIVMFSPSGGVESYFVRDDDPVSSGAVASGSMLAPLFLLVGRSDRLGTYSAGGETLDNAGAPDHLFNWQDLNNLWVVVRPQTGLAAAEEVTSATQFFDNTGTPKSDARTNARGGRGVGGR